jgi:anti-anti-sigma factor
MHINIQNIGITTVLELDGEFVFESFSTLRQACRPILDNAAIKFIQIELSKVNYVDSSALGMMLLMKEKAGHAGKLVQIKGAHGHVRGVLEVAKFDRMFELLN